MAADDWTDAAPASQSWSDWLASDSIARAAPQTADDFMRATASAMTFGMADRFAGYMGGEGTDAEVAKSTEARERSPYASVGGDVAGSLAMPGFGAEALATRLGANSARALTRLGARAGGYGAVGAGVGAAQGAGNTYTGDPMDYARNALVGGAFGGALGAAGGAAFGRGPARSAAETPTAPQLWTEKTANYGDLANSPARYEPGALANSADLTEQVLRAKRFHESRSPTSFQALDEMRGAPTAFPTGSAPVSPGDLEFIRQGMSNLNPLTEATDIASSKTVKQALDNFVRNPPPGAVLPGTERAAADASALAEKARGNYGGYKRVQAMDDLLNNAKNAAGAANSGLNLENQMRAGVRSFVRQTKGVSAAERAGFNDAEIAALTGYTRGTGGSNLLRWGGNMLGGGGGSVGAGAAGLVAGSAAQYAKGDPELTAAASVGAPTLGLLLRAISNRRANTNLRQLQDMIAQRTPLYQQRVATSGTVPGVGLPRVASGGRNAIALELLKRNQAAQPADASDWQ